MSKAGHAEVLSLDTSKQREVVKETKQLKKKIKDGTISVKEVRKAQKLSIEQQRGLLYISHLPHGFYEEELKKYFTQFGKVTNVKVCRSSRTGRSKGYGYVEFGHPEVAKIAAETMNNYLMFKKRITAEFVPYEKRPKGLFIGKSPTPSNYSSKIRRQKQYQANLKIDEKTHMKRSSVRLSKLNRKLGRLQKLGIKTTFTPENIAIIKQESKPSSVTHIYQADPFDSEVEIKVPLKKSSKSVKSLPDQMSLNKKSQPVTPKKSKSVTSIRSSNRNIETEQSVTRNKVDVAVSSPVLPTDRNFKKKLQQTRGIVKRGKKPAPLNSETVRKIARELIRKRGDSLLKYPAAVVNKSKRNLPKNKFEKYQKYMFCFFFSSFVFLISVT